jgi:hypothetical protein
LSHIVAPSGETRSKPTHVERSTLSSPMPGSIRAKNVAFDGVGREHIVMTGALELPRRRDRVNIAIRREDIGFVRSMMREYI